MANVSGYFTTLRGHKNNYKKYALLSKHYETGTNLALINN